MRRIRYIINKRYQYGMLVLLVAVVFVVIFLSILATHYFVISSIVNVAYQTGQMPTGKELLAASIRPVTIIVPIIFVVLAFIVIYVIYLSHRTAGPLYKLKEAMDRVGEGDLSIKLKFRKHDEIHDVAESFNRMVENLRKKFSKESHK
jgi:nitrogen fixation/metabolism regulation signal transduction histidine kinase